ncbi:MAG: hypothetical protein HEQ35_10685 [Gloeotrichia echinulata IR180]|jgi:hypothetical protein|nr:hypothetical protein [Gloeotrichia echinulata DEX184]
MRITDRLPGTSIWNKNQGWVCEPLPVLEANQIAVTINVKSGISQSQLEQSLDSLGIVSHYYYLGENDPKNPRAANLVYLAKVCHSYGELLETIGVLQSANIPVNAISVITPQLQKLATFKQFEQRQTA